MKKVIITSHILNVLITTLVALFFQMPAILCAEERIEHDNMAQSKTVYFPQFQLFQTVKNETSMLYGMEGNLILKDECLRIQSGKRDYLLIWPGWYEFGVAGGEIGVTHVKSGTVIARLNIGNRVSFSGAELENNPVNLQYAIPDQCEGPYWAVGDIESVKSQKTLKNQNDQVNKKSTPFAKKVNQSFKKNNNVEKTNKESRDLSKELIQLEIKLEDSIIK